MDVSGLIGKKAKWSTRFPAKGGVEESVLEREGVIVGGFMGLGTPRLIVLTGGLLFHPAQDVCVIFD